MRVRRLKIRNFRGIRDGLVDFPTHALLVGGNNAGKSTLCEALDLVLGPERLYRRPVVDEHDFHQGLYLLRPENDGAREVADTVEPRDEAAESTPVGQDAAADRSDGVIRIEVILVGLLDEAERRFRGHLRRWSESSGDFVDAGDSPSPVDADSDDTSWALPVAFLGRYNREEDDFEGATFFLHPQADVNEEDASKLGAGLRLFSREDKRLCGFVFLRALRTGSRALTLQKGSLLDTILRLSGDGVPEMWVKTLEKLHGLTPPIGDIAQLNTIQQEIQRRARRFIGLAPGQTTAFIASELTREHLREVVRLFVASEQSSHLLPFHRLGTGTVNVLVFALLTFIAELKKKQSVIFAMEEPEIALPPHTQRRIVRFVLTEMGQAVVTSHSPYVIEQFESQDIVVLTRESGGLLRAKVLEAGGVTSRMMRTQRRQFAEAVLGRAVLVVEGGTEVALFHAVSSALEAFSQPEAYVHLDLAGVTVFSAGSDRDVPRFGPVFAAMEKLAFAFCDKQKTPWPDTDQAALDTFRVVHEHEHSGIEDLLVSEVPASVHRTFLERVASRADYPQTRKYDPAMSDDDVRQLSREVLVARKGEAFGYCGLLVEGCTAPDQLPPSIVGMLTSIHEELGGEELLANETQEDETSDPEDVSSLEVDDARLAIIGGDGHMLVTGGPGQARRPLHC